MNKTTSYIPYMFIKSDINSLMLQLDNIDDLCEASSNLHKLIEQYIIKRADAIGLYDEYLEYLKGGNR